MQKLTDFLVEKSKVVLTIFLCITICSAWLMTKVNINTDMTKYLPGDSPTKIGAAVMDAQFSAASTFNIMFKGLDSDEKSEIYRELSDIENIQSVSYEAESEDYNKGDYTLYIVTIGASANSDEAKATVDQVTDQFSSYDISINGDAAGNTVAGILPKLAGMAFLILLIVLFMMCGSWVEPFLFLITIAAAILINMGTNIIFDSVSETTYSIAAILQLCLSIDYSVMLINRYRQEKRSAENKYDAMKKALRHAFAAISSSSVTTIVGMLALVFMSFTIGKDMGFVLAKGVLLSLICIFTVLPALILICDRLIEKTAKRSLHIKMDRLASFSYAIRKVIPVVFLALFVGSFLLKGNVMISYTMSDYYDINKIFKPNNPIVILYNNEDESKVGALAERWEDNPSVTSVNAYSTTIGRELTCDELAGVAGMDETMVAQLYYTYFSQKGEGQDIKIALSDFFGFVKEDVAVNEQFRKYFTDDVMAQYSAMAGTDIGKAMAQELSSKELAAYLNMDEAVAQQLYFYYAIVHGEMPQGTIALYDFIEFIAGEAAADETFKPFFSEDDLVRLEAAKTSLDDGLKQLVGSSYSRVILSTSLPEESDETFSFIKTLGQELDEAVGGAYYVLGNSAMAYEMSRSFPSEMNFITILTALAIFIVVAVAFRSLSIPLILVSIIQCAVFVTMGTVYIQGSSIYYLPLLIVQCLLMGATVDYGILYTSYYREARNSLDKKAALKAALNNSIHTIITSALILIAVTGVLGIMLKNSDQAIAEILLTIAKGGVCAAALVVFILPGLISALDRFVVRSRYKESPKTIK